MRYTSKAIAGKNDILMYNIRDEMSAKNKHMELPWTEAVVDNCKAVACE